MFAPLVVALCPYTGNKMCLYVHTPAVVPQAGRTGGMLATASLERVIDGLTESEKYNAVLQGVSGILMGKKKEGAAALGAFQEVFQLLDEMDANRIKCTIRTASAVVDAAAATTNIGIITQGIASSCRYFPEMLDLDRFTLGRDRSGLVCRDAMIEAAMCSGKASPRRLL